MTNIFKIKGFRKSQSTISKEQARLIVKNLICNDTSNRDCYGKNGKMLGRVIGAVVQHSKKNPWGYNNTKSTFGYQK
tara:strand:+ start:271 stop:501 length:231 start_codon:yes stop_codon:yes gene_type:complete